MEEGRVLCSVGRLHLREVARQLRREKEAEYGTEARNRERNPRLRSRPRHAVRKLLGPLLKHVVDALSPQNTQDCESRGHRERITRERPRLVDGAERGKMLADLAPAAERADGQTAADDLSQAGKIGRHARSLLHSPLRNTEAGDHLVENQQRVVRGGQPPQPLQKTLRRAVCRYRRNQPHVPCPRFDDHGGDTAAETVERLAHPLKIVVRNDERRRGHALRNTAAVGFPQGERAAPGAHQHAVGVPVVAAVELQHDLPPSETARQAERRHHRLGPGGDETYQIHRGEDAPHLLGKFDLFWAGRAEGGRLPRGNADSLDNFRMGVSEDQRPPAAHVVRIPPAVDGVEKRPLAPLKKERRSADSAPRAHRTVHAADKRAFRPLEEFRAVHHFKNLP